MPIAAKQPGARFGVVIFYQSLPDSYSAAVAPQNFVAPALLARHHKIEGHSRQQRLPAADWLARCPHATNATGDEFE